MEYLFGRVIALPSVENIQTTQPVRVLSVLINGNKAQRIATLSAFPDGLLGVLRNIDLPPPRLQVRYYVLVWLRDVPSIVTLGLTKKGGGVICYDIRLATKEERRHPPFSIIYTSPLTKTECIKAYRFLARVRKGVENAL